MTTHGLGHTRILRDTNVVNAAIEFVTAGRGRFGTSSVLQRGRNRRRLTSQLIDSHANLPGGARDRVELWPS